MREVPTTTSASTTVEVVLVIHVPLGASVSDAAQSEIERWAHQRYDPSTQSVVVTYRPGVSWAALESEFSRVLPMLDEAVRQGWQVDYPAEAEIDVLLAAMDQARDWLYAAAGKLIQARRAQKR